MKSLRSLVLVWYWDQREYILWIMAVTLPKTSACISATAGRDKDKQKSFRLSLSENGMWNMRHYLHHSPHETDSCDGQPV